MKIKNYKDFSCFLEYVQDPDFRGAIVSDNVYHFRSNVGLFKSAVNFFKESGLEVKEHSIPLKIEFPSGATIRLLRVENTRGMLLDAALVLNTDTLTYEDTLQVKSRIKTPCSSDGSLWFLESY